MDVSAAAAPSFRLPCSLYVHYTPAMPTAPRLLRAEIEDIPGARPRLSQRELDRQEVILAAGRRVLVNHGRAGIRLSDLATALGMAPGTIRRYFPDLDCLLGEILVRHLLSISSAIGRAVRDVPIAERQPAARTAYLAATRTVLGGHTEAHLLLLRERHHLPPDQLGPIEGTRAGLGDMLAGEHGTAALGLLDMPELTAGQIEGMLCVLDRPARGAPRLQVVSRMDVSAGRVKPKTGGLGAWADETGACADPPKARVPQPFATADP